MFQSKKSHHLLQKSIFYPILSILVFALISSACRLLSNDRQAIDTLVAIRVQQTQLAGTTSSNSIPELTEQTYIIPTPGKSDILATASQVASTPATDSLSIEHEIPNFERRRKAARILLFENMSASGYVRYVKEALDLGGYFYLDVGSATGWFRNQLVSPQEWDLIISAAEARRDFGGEFFELLNQHLEKGEAAIIEHWDIDQAPNGKVSQIFTNCGLRFDTDWYEPELRVFFWLVPEHPIFHIPNEIPMFSNANWLWRGDIGDLLDIDYRAGQPVGDATLLAGTSPTIKDQHGTLAVCMGDRLILQTFASHEYSNHDVIRLWQNYIYHALQGRFASQPASLIPTPWVEGLPSVPSTATFVPATPSAPGSPVGCQGILEGQLSRPFHTQRQLFEHNAEGEFVIIDLELMNVSQQPILIWDGDYRIEGYQENRLVSFALQKAATGFMYIEKPKNLWQDLLMPRQAWGTTLAFDVDPRGDQWMLVVSPGLEVNEQICEMRIPLF